MKMGNKTHVNWDNYKVYHFPLFKNPVDYDARGGCGTNALGCITKKPLSEVSSNLPRTQKYWTDTSVKKYLSSLGYQLIPLTINQLISNSSNDRITPFHVLLVSQYVYEDEGTYSVIWNNFQYHSGTVDILGPYEFLRNPFWTGFVVWHPAWEEYNKHEDAAVSLNYLKKSKEYRLLNAYKSIIEKLPVAQSVALFEDTCDVVIKPVEIETPKDKKEKYKKNKKLYRKVLDNLLDDVQWRAQHNVFDTRRKPSTKQHRKS